MKNEDVADLEQIEINIAGAKLLMDEVDTLNRLEENEDFKKIIIEGFFKAHVCRLVKMKALPSCQDELNQNFIMAQIDAVGQLEQFFTGIRIQGNSARNALEADQLEREKILAEQE